MSGDVFQAIATEMDQVEQLLNKEMRLRAGYIEQFAPLNLNSLDRRLCPSLVILSAQLFGCRNKKVIPLACVLQFIHLATLIHRSTREDPGLLVLVGDYFYTRFFSYLCEHDSLPLLAELSRTICDINEGGISEEHPLPEDRCTTSVHILDRTYGRLLAQACIVGGQLAGATVEQLGSLKEFGRNVGIAWGATRSGKRDLPVEKYLGQAKAALGKLPEGTTRNLLERLAWTVAMPEERQQQIAAV
ncbi:MAG: polyprenyl synthetase family protein [Bacillota bacterium]